MGDEKFINFHGEQPKEEEHSYIGFKKINNFKSKVYPNGDIYQGYFDENGLRHGHG